MNPATFAANLTARGVDPKVVAFLSRFFSEDTKVGRLRWWGYQAILQHRRDGTIPTSLRHLYYEAVMDVACPDVQKHSTGARRSDQDLTEAMTDLREQGLVEWAEIEDRTRHLIQNFGWTSIAEGVEAYVNVVKLDPYRRGGKELALPILVVESESVAGVTEAQADEYRIPIIPTRGPAAGFLRNQVASFLGGRPVHVGYIGDADKAGGDIEDSSERTLREVLNVQSWTRLALTWPQVISHGLPTEFRRDGRDKKTYEVCEVEALPQIELRALVEAFLNGHLPAKTTLAAVEKRAETQRKVVRRKLA